MRRRIERGFLIAIALALTHTINDAAEETALLRAGISGIHTDDLLP